MEKKVVLVLLNNSLGEIHFILPYLKRLEAQADVDIFYYFINARILNKAVDDPFYHDQILEHATILKPNDLLPFLMKRKQDVVLILKDTTPLTEKNIALKIKAVCTNARFVLFPHAYALLGYQDAPIVKGKTLPVEDAHVDHVLYVHAFDAPVLAKRYDPAKLLFAGALGYDSWWADQVAMYVRQNTKRLIPDTSPREKTILFTLRDVHKLYLSEKNFDALFKSSLELLFNHTDYFIIIKPHPRQHIDKLKQYLSGYDEKRYKINYFNTFVLSQYAALNLSFWSSAVTDCLAMGIPSLEYHRFHVPFGQTVETGTRLQSFYDYVGLTKAVQSQEELKEALPVNPQGMVGLYQAQKAALDSVFNGTEKGFDNFTSLIVLQKPTQRFSGVEKASALIYFFLKYIFRKFKPV